MELRAFNQYDWGGYAGAERFDDGGEPLIIDGYVSEAGLEVTIIADGNGVQIILDSEDENGEFEMAFANLDREDSEAFTQLMMRAFAAIA